MESLGYVKTYLPHLSGWALHTEARQQIARKM